MNYIIEGEGVLVNEDGVGQLFSRVIRLIAQGEIG